MGRFDVRAEDRECPISTALEYVGDWWTLLLLHDLMDGFTRFDEFQANLDISSSVLTSRLQAMMQKGMVERTLYQHHPPRYAYHLTAFGQSFRPIVLVLAAWQNARLQPDDRSVILVDAESGHEAEPVVVDGHTGAAVDSARFQFRAGPAASTIIRRRYARERA